MKMDSNLNNLTVPELKTLARTRGLTGFSRFRKNELVLVLQKATQPTLPRDIQFELMINMDPPELMKLCTSDKQLNQLCSDERFTNWSSCYKKSLNPPYPTLPRDIQFELMINMDPPELMKLCTSDKQLNQLCSDERFWQQLVVRRFGQVSLINNSWRETFINAYKYGFIQPYIDAYGTLDEFLNVVLPILTRSMSIVPDEADKYRIRLPNDLVLKILAGTGADEEIANAFKSLRRNDIPDSNKLYRFNHKRFYEKFDIDDFLDFIPNLVNPPTVAISPLVNRLTDPTLLDQFLNSAIPSLHYTSVVHRKGPNYVLNWVFAREYLELKPQLTIYETGESFSAKINKYYISLLDLLKAIMSVKVYKEASRGSEILFGIEAFDHQQQIITLDME